MLADPDVVYWLAARGMVLHEAGWLVIRSVCPHLVPGPVATCDLQGIGKPILCQRYPLNPMDWRPEGCTL